MKICLVVFALALCQINGELSEEQRKLAHESLYNNDGAYNGDMMLTGGQKAALKNRVAMNNKNARWPGGIIPYYVDPSVSSITGLIQQAAAHIANETGNCIRWVPRTNQGKYVRIFNGNGCYSSVGMAGPGPQDLSLNLQGCALLGTVVHEMLHAVGFNHEQNRPDRDRYLNIYWENIIQSMQYNFNLEANGLTYTDFDFDSIMLYGEQAFTNDWSKKTMLDKTGVHKLKDPYDKKGLTAWDTYEIKRFYDCKI